MQTFRIKRFFVLISCFSFSFSCTSMFLNERPFPVFSGVDPELAPYVQEYLNLAKTKGILFKNKVSVGMIEIKSDDGTVGKCHSTPLFREIDIDKGFWTAGNKAQKKLLLFHELTHCYCGRDHIWSETEEYPEDAEDRLEQALDWVENGGPRPGYLEDGCPSSIMHPLLLKTECFNKHYSHYMEEMFNYCKPF